MKQRWVWAVALIFGARYFAAAWFEPQHDGDLGWQQWLGQYILAHGALPKSLGPEAFAAQGSPWVPQEWALSLLVAHVLGTPWFGVLAFAMALIAASVIVITGAAARRMGASELAIAVCATAVAFSMVQSFGVRAQVPGWLMLALFMLVLRTLPEQRQWWLVPLTVLWANLHASVMLAPVLLGIWTAGVALEERAWNARTRRYAVLTVAAAVALCLTPLGVHLPAYALTLSTSPIRSLISEWQPTTIESIAFAAGLLPFILLMCLAGFARPWRWTEVLVFTAATVLSLTAGRNIPVASIIIAPLAARRLTDILPERFDIAPMKSALERLGFAALGAGGSILVAVLLIQMPHFTETAVPVRAIAVAAAVPGTHRIYCEDFAWCSWALAHPNLREFIDGRCDPFPAHIWKDYETVYKVHPRWNRILNRERIDVVLAARTRPLAEALRLSGAWRQIYIDSTYALFIRRAG